MEKIKRSDVLANSEYLKQREDRRKKIIDLKKLRRVEVGDHLSFTFENRETVLYQIQEMMRVEHISDETKIDHEIEVYNELVPERGSLSATMFIEIPDPDKIKSTLDTFQGLDRPDTVFITVNDDKVYAEFEPGHSREDRISAVHYVKFSFTPEQVQGFGDAKVELRVQHPSYQAHARLSPEQQKELAKDLQ